MIVRLASLKAAGQVAAWTPRKGVCVAVWSLKARPGNLERVCVLQFGV